MGVAGLVACAAIAQTPSINDIIASHITANDLKGDVSFLASDALEGRATPSRGLDLAGEFIASQFRRAGLEPAGNSGNLGNDSYFQTANFETVTLNLADVTLSVDVGGESIQATAGTITVQSAVQLDLKSVPVINATDPAVMAALTPEQVHGKVLAMGIGPAFRLGKLEPAAVMSLPGPGRGGRGGMRPALREAGSTLTMPALAVTDPRVQEALRTKDSAITISIHIPAPAVVPVKLRNVIGVLRGSDPQLKDTYLMLTAHYDHLGVLDNGTADHIFNGADDDASGTASVIEIASALAAMPTRPKRSVIFIALFGEELGDLGSRYYAQHPIFPLAKTVADVNLEQLGRTDDTEGPHVHMFNLTGYDFTDLPATFNKVGEQTGIKAVKNEKNSDPYFTRSDNAAFAQAGVPSTTLSVAYDFPDYHKVGDEWEKLDYENMALVDRTIALAAIDLANSAETTKWNEANPKTAAFVKARQANLSGDKP
jgi:hypothetical protein